VTDRLAQPPRRGRCVDEPRRYGVDGQRRECDRGDRDAEPPELPPGEGERTDREGAAPGERERIQGGPRPGGEARRKSRRRDRERYSTAVAVSIGIRMPCLRAQSMASSYPASACRITPVPGSVVSTRSSRRAASAVPSATTTMPAWSE
jgi:hypothetical protein